MRNLIVSIFVLVLLIACESSTIFKKPENLIPEQTMAELIVDLELARYAKGKKNNFMDTKMEYTHLVYEKYGIDSAQYVESNKYYVSNLETYRRIHENVKVLLEQKKVYYDSIKVIEDSLNIKNRKEILKKGGVPLDFDERIDIQRE